MQAPNMPMAGAGQQQQVNLAQLQAAQQQLAASGMVPLRTPNGQVFMVPQAAMNNPALLQQILLSQQQQQAQAQAMQNNPQAQALLGAGRGLPVNLQLLQQQQQQQAGQRPLQLPGAQGAVALAQQQQLQLALQRQAQHQAAAQQQLQQPGGAAAIRPALQQPMPPLTANFTQDQLDTLREQIVVFKKHKKGEVQVTADELAKCKPKPLPAALHPRPPQVVVPPAAAVAAAAAAAQAGVLPGGPGAVRPLQGGIRPQLASGLAALTAGGGAMQNQQLRAATPTGLGRGQALGGAAAAGAPGRPGQQQAGRPGADAAAAAVKPEPPKGPSHPPMDEPVRRLAGPVLSMQNNEQSEWC